MQLQALLTILALFTLLPITVPTNPPNAGSNILFLLSVSLSPPWYHGVPREKRHQEAEDRCTSDREEEAVHKRHMLVEGPASSRVVGVVGIVEVLG